MKLMLKVPGIQRLKPKYDKLLSNVAFKSNLRHHISGWHEVAEDTGAMKSAFGALKESAEAPPAPATEKLLTAAMSAGTRAAPAAATAASPLGRHPEVGPGGVCLFLCPNFLCSITQIQPIMLGLCPIMPNYAQLCLALSRGGGARTAAHHVEGLQRLRARQRQGGCSLCTGARHYI